MVPLENGRPVAGFTGMTRFLRLMRAGWGAEDISYSKRFCWRFFQPTKKSTDEKSDRRELLRPLCLKNLPAKEKLRKILPQPECR
jgi:hypothetical protein